jgi:hypothetical protein
VVFKPKWPFFISTFSLSEGSNPFFPVSIPKWPFFISTSKVSTVAAEQNEFQSLSGLSTLQLRSLQLLLSAYLVATPARMSRRFVCRCTFTSSSPLRLHLNSYHVFTYQVRTDDYFDFHALIQAMAVLATKCRVLFRREKSPVQNVSSIVLRLSQL